MFLADQGRDAVIVRRIATLQKFPLIGPPSSIGEVFLGPFYYYLVAPFMWLFKLHPVGLAFGVALLSIGALLVIFYIVKKAVSYRTAFVFTSILGTSGLLVSVARFSWNPNLLPYASFITLSLFYLAMHGKRRGMYSLLFGIAFGLTFQLHHLAALIALPVAAYYLIYSVKKKQFPQLDIPALSAGGFFLTLIPFVWFELRHNFLNTTNLISLFTRQNLVSSGPIASRIIDVSTAFIGFAFGYPVNTAAAMGVLAGVLVGTGFFLWKKNHPFILLHLISVVLLLIGLSRVNAAAIPHYYHTVYLSFYLICVYCVLSLSKKYQLVISLVFIALFFTSQFRTYDFLWGESSRQDASPKVVGAFIAKVSKGRKINLATYPVEFTSRDSYQYFIEYFGGSVVDGNSAEVTDTMYVLCDRQPCKVLDSHSWNIDMFGKAKIDTIFYEGGIVIYRLKHRT
jgi:4-amino-4-deoxy-L-arabinose transferase-like glycosyltransferase